MKTDRKTGEDSALCGRCKLAPGESRQIRFAVGWYFPNHFGDSGRFEGHWYAEHFADAGEVVSYLDRERDAILPAVKEFSDITEKHECFKRAGGRVVGSFEHADQMLLVDKAGRVRYVGRLRQLRLPYDRHHLSGFIWYSGIVSRPSEKTDGNGRKIPAWGRTRTPFLYPRPVRRG